MKQRNSRYTCPMHPEIQQDHPGDCPICGMPLEILGVIEENKETIEQKDLQKALWGAADDL